MTMIDEIYSLLSDFGFYDYSPLIGVLGEVLAMILIALAFTTPVMVVYSVIVWIMRGAKYDN